MHAWWVHGGRDERERAQNVLQECGSRTVATLLENTFTVLALVRCVCAAARPAGIAAPLRKAKAKVSVEREQTCEQERRWRFKRQHYNV